MHSSACDLEAPRVCGGEVLVTIAALVTEGRTPTKPVVASAARGFSEGPHCTASKASQGHVCNLDNALCIKYDKIRSYVLALWQKSLPLCIDVLLVPKCCCENDLVCNPSTSNEPIGSAVLLEQWHVSVTQKRTHDFSTNLNVNQLINAIRSQLYFSQISAWLATPEDKVQVAFQNKCVVYCLTVPGETFGCTKFASSAQHHNFPIADLGNGVVVRVSLSNLPRSEEIPLLKCSKCDVHALALAHENHISSVLDDRMQMSCTLKGKHRCDDFDEVDNCCQGMRYKKTTKSTTTTTTTTTTSINSNTSCSNSLNGVGVGVGVGAGAGIGVESTPSTSTSRALFSNLSNNHCTECGAGGLQGAAAGKCDKSKVDLELSRKEFVEVLSVLRKSGPMKKKHDLEKPTNKGDILLDAILRSSKVQAAAAVAVTGEREMSLERSREKRKCSVCALHGIRVRDNTCDTKNDSAISDNISRLGGNDNIYIDINCDNIKRKKTDYIKMCDISNVFSLEYLEKRQKVKVKQRITFDDDVVPILHDDTTSQCNRSQSSDYAASTHTNTSRNTDTTKATATATTTTETNLKEFHPPALALTPNGIPSALEQAKFRKSLDSAASMVFHSRTGLPLTSSPAPVRRGKSCFDFDSSINSVSAIRSALFSLASCSTDEDSESDCSILSPCSPDATNGLQQREIPPINYRHRGQSSGLLGSFVESVLNGRLEPVSTVHGFSAELGASGSFCPRHVVLPVTVFFYTLGDNDKVSTPYLGHINLGKKGYNVPKSGTIQVTLFNPLGTVVKMFVIMYDLSDMPPNSQTFIRQRTLFMPANCQDKDLEWSQKWLRYLIHLRFMSSKSGRIYLHSDIRMIICRKSDLDTATAHGLDMSYELRSFTNCPTNPRFSPRK